MPRGRVLFLNSDFAQRIDGVDPRPKIEMSMGENVQKQIGYGVQTLSTRGSAVAAPTA